MVGHVKKTKKNYEKISHGTSSVFIVKIANNVYFLQGHLFLLILYNDKTLYNTLTWQWLNVDVLKRSLKLSEMTHLTFFQEIKKIINGRLVYPLNPRWEMYGIEKQQ